MLERCALHSQEWLYYEAALRIKVIVPDLRRANQPYVRA